MPERLFNDARERRKGWLVCHWIAAAILALATLPACSPSKPMTVVLHPWVGYETLYLARDLKWLPDSVRLRDVRTLGESIAALKAGEVDAACMTLDEMLRARAAGIPLAAALVFDVSAGADAVMVRPHIKRLSDLAGKRIAYDHQALGALVFAKLLEAARLTTSDVIQVDLPPDRQLEAWRRKEVDAVITYEPMLTPFRREGAQLLFDSRQMPDTIIDVLVVRRDRADLEAPLRALAAAHFRALAHMHSSEQDALFRIAAREGLTPEEARSMLAGVILPTLDVNRAYLYGEKAYLLAAAEALSALMVRRGLLAREDDLKDLILPGILPGEER